MGVKILVEVSSKLIVELPIEKYSDIDEENMSLEMSDEMISDEIYTRYGFNPHHIKVIKEVRNND